jgi:pyrroloquinoline quinone biosynthesis protein B
LAVSVDGERWLLLNASPDIRQQIAATPQLRPRHGLRHTPLAAVLLTNGDVDHVAGLLSLRERQPFELFGTAETLHAVGDNRIFDVVARDVVPRTTIALEQPFAALPGLTAELFAVPGKVPLWLEDEALEVGNATETTVGVVLTDGSKRIVYVPGCAKVTPRLQEKIDGAGLLLFDGTLWRDDEMIAAGVGTKTGGRMGHLQMSGPEGSIASLAGLAVGQKTFVHINNTNPALIEDSPERRELEAAGWTVAHDGMVFSL